MSTSLITNQSAVFCATSMETLGPQDLHDNQIHCENQVRDTKGVEANPTPPPAMEGATVAHLADNQHRALDNRLDNVRDQKDRLSRGVMVNSRKSKSGDADRCHAHDCVEVLAAKKRKTRRGKPKYRKLKPYSKREAYQRTRRRSGNQLMKKTTQPPAPYNTTQFLMADHNDLPDFKEKLAAKSEMPRDFQKPLAPPRTRDSSFSIDSDEEYFYSSPEDEKEFLTKEFSSAYEDLQAERLNAMSKYDLIQEYIQLEAKFEVVSKRLRSKNYQPTADEGKSTLPPIDSDLAKKLKICQQRIDDLTQQAEQLRRDNERLRGKTLRSPSPESSIDSESDSVSSNRSGCSCSAPSATAVSPDVNGRLSAMSSASSSSSSGSSSDTVSSKDNLGPSAPGSPQSVAVADEMVNGRSTSPQQAELT